MTDKQTQGQRNLRILTLMGLICQCVGVIFVIVAIAGVSDSIESPLWGALCMTFGIALSGWAGNLQEITSLKRRVAELEAHTSNNVAAKP